MSNRRTFFNFGSPIYLNANRTFINNKSIKLKDIVYITEKSRLNEFPIIDDFSLIYQIRKRKKINYSIHFVYYSKKNGILNYFPCWCIDPLKIKNIKFDDIPIGTIDNIYFDVDYSILNIFEKRNYIYVLYGSYNSDYEEYKTWYKICKDTYFNKWLELIDWFNTIANF